MKPHTYEPSPATPPADLHDTRGQSSFFKSTKAWFSAAAAASVLFLGYQACVNRIAFNPAPPGAPGPLGFYVSKRGYLKYFSLNL